jgi:hypothetical protein
MYVNVRFPTGGSAHVSIRIRVWNLILIVEGGLSDGGSCLHPKA